MDSALHALAVELTEHVFQAAFDAYDSERAPSVVSFDDEPPEDMWEGLTINGDKLTLCVHGVPKNDAYLSPTNGLGIKRGPTTRPESVLVIDVTISDYIKPPINITLNVIVDLVLHRRLGIYHEALVQPIAKMSKQGVVGPYTHVGLNEVVNWSDEIAVDSPPMFTVYMASPKLVYYRVLMAANTFDNFMLNVCEFMGCRVTESNVARAIGL